MKRKSILLAIAAALLAGSAWGQIGGGHMGGPFGPGIGRGAMGGFGNAAGMGAWMMGQGGYEWLGLTAEQRSRIAAIEERLWRTEWELMARMQDLFDSRDYERMAALRRQMIEAAGDAREEIEALLTPEQLARLNERAGCRW